ncbi:MAG: ATPase, T2SS/T4P/T4SS family [Geodermatophilaceae bacterium]
MSGPQACAELSSPHICPPPSRIVVGEVRAEECLDLLLALNSGLPGMATVHANSAREALVKLCTLPLLAGARQRRRQSASRL